MAHFLALLWLSIFLRLSIFVLSNETGTDNGGDGESDNTGNNDGDQTDMATMGQVSVNQMTGKIYLPSTTNQPSKREIHVVVC